jgi:putative ABC transport system permease protein
MFRHYRGMAASAERLRRHLMRDARLAARLLARRPGYAAVALVTLALGVGAPTAIFSVVHAVLLRPLPYPDADRLLRFRMEVQTPRGATAFDALPASTAETWAMDTRTLSGLALFNETALTLSTPNGPFRLNGIAAAPNLFDVLGVAPARGRGFTVAAPDPHEIIISHAMWTTYFAASPAAVGSSIVMNAVAYRVVGVMGATFAFPDADTEFWVPLLLTSGGSRGMALPAIGRLKATSTIAAALDEGARLLDDGDTRIHSRLEAETVRAQLVGGVSHMLWLLMAAVSLVSIVATANLSLLLLTRGAGREREFAVRLALGATRGQLIRQLIVEAGVLAGVGGLAGLGVAILALKAIIGSAPAAVPRLQDAGLDGPVLLFALAVTVGASLIFGVLSVGRSIGIDPVGALAGSSSASGLVRSAPSRRRLNLLASAGLALTMVLLVGAGLLLRSFVDLLLVDQGFAPKGALAFQVNLPTARYPTPTARLAFELQLLDQIQHAGFVSSAGLISTMPNRQPTGRFDYDPTGVPVVIDPFSLHISEVRMATEGFFEAMGIPILAGRGIRASDTTGAEPVMVISKHMAVEFFKDENPVGRLLYSGSGTRRVVGVVADVRPVTAGDPIASAAYLPLRQTNDVLDWLTSMNVVVRGADRRTLETSTRTLVLGLDHDMPPANVRWLDDEIATLVAAPRFSASLLALFAGVALVLAAIGVYGVSAYSAGLRTREIGVRVALGATRPQVLWLMLRDASIAVAGGLAGGAVAAVLAAHAFTTLLHGVQPADPVAIAVVGTVLAAASLLAAYVPARRATRVSALDALRHD